MQAHWQEGNNCSCQHKADELIATFKIGDRYFDLYVFEQPREKEVRFSRLVEKGGKKMKCPVCGGTSFVWLSKSWWCKRCSYHSIHKWWREMRK